MHRVAWELTNGGLSSTWPIRQTCQNPLCCNPFHMKAERPRDSIWTLITAVNATFWADVEEFAAGCEDQGLSASTVLTYRSVLRRFTEWLSVNYPEVKSIVDLERIHTRMFDRALRSELAGGGKPITARTRAKYLTVVRSMLKYFALETDLPVLSRDRVRLPKVPDQLPRAFAKPEDVQLLVDSCDTSTVKGRRDRAILGLFFATGMRIAELCSLDRSAFPLTRLGVADVIDARVVGKGTQPRLILVGRDAQHLVGEMLTDRGDNDPALFVHFQKGNPTDAHQGDARIGPRGLQKMFQKRLAAVGLPEELTPHSLRHGLATNLPENGADLRQIQGVLGHKNIATTQIYTHLTTKTLQGGYLKRTQLLVVARRKPKRADRWPCA